MKKELLTSLGWAGGIVLVALTASWARNQGHIDHETVQRIVIGLIGLMIVFYGNRIPKAVAPSAMAARLTRVAGWSLVVSGLIYAALWAFAPIPVAVAGGCAAVLAGMAVTFAYGFRLRAQAAS